MVNHFGRMSHKTSLNVNMTYIQVVMTYSVHTSINMLLTNLVQREAMSYECSEPSEYCSKYCYLH